MNLPDLNWPLIAAAMLPWGTLALAALFTPRLTRPDLFFAVTVHPSFRQSPEGRNILRRYDRSVVVVAFLALLLMGLIQFGTETSGHARPAGSGLPRIGRGALHFCPRGGAPCRSMSGRPPT